MDPQAAWRDLIAAYAEGDWHRLIDVADGLLAWLDRGGFPPDTGTLTQEIEPDRTADWNRAIARSACLFAKELIPF